MPTGYTEIIERKPDVSFEEFALRCARAFDALVTMRDEPTDAEIPAKFTPSGHHQEALKKAKAELERVTQMSLEDAKKCADILFKKESESYFKTVKERTELRARYEAMLRKVKEWVPPTSDHVAFQLFMEKQLTDSVDFDCGIDYLEKPRLLTPAGYKNREIRNLKRDVAYHSKEFKEEVERTKSRNEWLRLLRASLPDTEAVMD